MREYAKKMPRSALNLSDPQAAQGVDVNSGSLKRLFHGWLSEVAPLSDPQPHRDSEDVGIRRIALPENSAMAAGPTVTSMETFGHRKHIRTTLTIRDLIALDRATVREGDEHRHWPREVVLKFMAADVVTRKRKAH